MGKVKAGSISKPGTEGKDKSRSPKQLKKINKPPKAKLNSKVLKHALKNEAVKKELLQGAPKKLKEKVTSPKKVEKPTSPKKVGKATSPKKAEKATSPKKAGKATSPKKTGTGTSPKKAGTGTSPKKAEKASSPKKGVKVTSPKKVNKIEKNAQVKAIELKEQAEVSQPELDKSTVESAVKAIFQLKEQNSDKNELFDEEQPIYLQITVIKVPTSHPKILRLSLPNSVLTDDSEICLITQNIKDDKKNDEKAVETYEELLKSNGITNIKKIIPLNQLLQEYSVYEMQQRLVELYDYFLLDSRATGKTFKSFGGILNKQNKSPAIIKLNASNLKGMIESKLKQVQFIVHSNGDNFTVQVGHMKMEEEQIVENIFGLTKELNVKFPGSFKNIKALNIKSPLGMAIPVYINLVKNSTVKVPIVKPNRPKAFKAVTDELSTAIDTTVTVLPTGTVLLNKKGEDNDIFDKRNKQKLNKLHPHEKAMIAELKRDGELAAGIPKKVNQKKGKGKKVMVENKTAVVEKIEGEVKKGNNKRKIVENVQGQVVAAVPVKIKKAGKKAEVQIKKEQIKG